jgi:hypothetical protein
MPKLPCLVGRAVQAAKMSLCGPPPGVRPDAANRVGDCEG